MARRCWALVCIGIVTLWAFAIDVDAGVPLSDEKGKATGQVQGQGKGSSENDVQSRGLFSKKSKKKKVGGGAAARSQPSDRIDSTSGNPADRVMP